MTENQGRLPVLVNLTTNQPYQIIGPNTTLGRAPENNIVLGDDGYASAHHARVFFENGGWWLEDNGSSNGTFVNDKAIQGRHQLTPNDVIKVGRTHFRIQ